jgi:hypothetical protein
VLNGGKRHRGVVAEVGSRASSTARIFTVEVTAEADDGRSIQGE